MKKTWIVLLIIIAVPVCGFSQRRTANQSETFKLIDLRTASSENKYLIGFLATPPDPWPGHAFILWMELANAACRIKAIGFYPAPNQRQSLEVRMEQGAITEFGFQSEFKNDMRLTTQVSHGLFAFVDKWKYDESISYYQGYLKGGRPYFVGFSDCVSFVGRVADKVELKTPRMRVVNPTTWLPKDYVYELLRLNEGDSWDAINKLDGAFPLPIPTPATNAPSSTHPSPPPPSSTGRSAQRNEGFVINIDPSNYDKRFSRWSQNGPNYEANPRMGRYGATHTHAFGAGTGNLTYQFSIDASNINNAEVTARLSSEFREYSGPPNGFSDVTLFVNGNRCGTQRVIPDNGSGRIYSWQVSGEYFQTGLNALTFAVEINAQYHNGLCIYYKSLARNGQDAPIQIGISHSNQGNPQYPNSPSPPNNQSQIPQNFPPQRSEARSLVVQVSANKPWTDTGIEINTGDELIIEAGGMISISRSDRGKGPQGEFCPQTFMFTLQNCPCWSLIGSIGQSPGCLGAQARFFPQAPGRLYLGVNDSNHRDNSGYWTVRVTIIPRQ